MSDYKCIVVIVDRGLGDDVIAKAKSKGAYGGTLVSGRGSSIHEKRKFLDFMVKPEKDLVLVVVKKNLVTPIKELVKKDFEIEQVGKGILFVFDVEDVVGIDIPLDDMDK